MSSGIKKRKQRKSPKKTSKVISNGKEILQNFGSYNPIPNVDNENEEKYVDPLLVPLFQVNTKKDQFDKMLLHCSDMDLSRTRKAKNQIEEAAKSFGLNKVKADNGRWLLEGMNTCK
jgi:hypothetical protein